MSRWFGKEIDRQRFLWVFSLCDKSSRVIATLESLAVLLALKAFYGSESQEVRRKIRLQPTWTENRGNGSANKLVSPQYPINAVLMELAAHCKQSGIVPLVSWAPRLFDREADDLANGRTQAFSPAIQWHVLPQVLPMGQEAYRTSREMGTLQNRGVESRKRKPEERLKLADPW